MSAYTFDNVTITIHAASAKDAYEQLREVMRSNHNVGYTTDTYTNAETEEVRKVDDLRARE